jgi:hypothetical protein
MFASYQEYRHRLHVEQNHRGPRGSYNNIITDLQETRTTISTDQLEQEGSLRAFGLSINQMLPRVYV